MASHILLHAPKTLKKKRDRRTEEQMNKMSLLELLIAAKSGIFAKTELNMLSFGHNMRVSVKFQVTTLIFL